MFSRGATGWLILLKHCSRLWMGPAVWRSIGWF
uniref:Uncharacterized protein n=1 Tax=Anguilla anguilla TaxID=7936 RepID=A0A0E9TGX2_ANGAN